MAETQDIRKGIILMILSSVFACVGQLLWKISAERGVFILILGFGFYGIGALLMLAAYRFGELSRLQPILSLNYVISLVLGYFYLHETINLLKIAGIILVTLGVILIAGGSKE